MDLLEYQAKELFRTVGIPVLPAQQITQPRDMKDLSVPYPVVLKSQVYTGGRGRVGGVRFVENTIDGIAAAQAIFNLPIMGEYPKVLLAESKYDATQELYLAVTLNPAVRRPVLLGSSCGGVDLQSSIDQTHQVVVDEEFSAFYGRRLAMAMGLEGPLMNTVSDVIEKMYRLMIQKDLDLVEVNPLAVRDAKEVMALDGKVTVNDAALARHPDLQQWQRVAESALVMPLVLQPTNQTAGSWGVISSGRGLTMATVDQLSQAGAAVDSFIDVGGAPLLAPKQFCDRMTQALSQMVQRSSIRRIVVNLLPEMLQNAALPPLLKAVESCVPTEEVVQQPVVPLVPPRSRCFSIDVCGLGAPQTSLPNRNPGLVLTFYPHLDDLLERHPWRAE